MLDVFKARLKAKTKAAGVNLSTKRIDAYADRLHKKNPDTKEEADHDALIDALDELVSFADVAKEDDRVRTLEAKAKPAKKDQDTDTENDDDEEEDSGKPKRDRTPKWARELMDEVKTLKTEKVQSSVKQKLAEKLKDEKIPEKFYSKIPLPEKEEELDAFAEGIKTDYAAFKQDLVNEGFSQSSKPNGGSATAPAAAVVKDIESWAAKGEQKAVTK